MLAVIVAGALAAAGCNTSSQGGSPGTTTSFTLKGPTIPESVKQGDTKTFDISLDRGKDFKQRVDLKVDAPKGLTAVLKSTKIASGDAATVALTVTADKDAPIGDHEIKITGSPETGAATDVKVTVKVAAR